MATAAIAVLLRRSGAPSLPVVLLAGVPIAVLAHGSAKVDVLGMVLVFIGIVWLELGWNRAEGQRTSPTT